MRGILTWLLAVTVTLAGFRVEQLHAENWLAPAEAAPHAKARAAKFQTEAPTEAPTEEPAATRSVVTQGEEVQPFEDARGEESPWSVGYDEPIASPDIAPFPYGVDYWFEVTGANQGLGYQGSYATVGGLFPYAHDDLGGMWFVEGRAHLSENGNFFSNFGWGRRQYINPGLSAGVSFWYDYDGDKATQFGHEFHQVGLSGDISGDWWTARINGYIPVNRKGYANSGFWQNFVLAANGIDTAMDGVDGEFGFRFPIWGARREAIWNVGGYAYSSDLIDSFSGFSTRLELPSQSQAATLQLQLNYDERFKTTGFVSLVYHFGSGGGRRAACSSCDDIGAQGAPLQRTQRNAHIVRFHRDPLIAINPATGGAYRAFTVDNSAPAGGNGTFEHPFDTLEEADVAANANYDIIFVRNGDGTAAGYNTNVALLPHQQLLGDGVSHFVMGQNGLIQLSGSTNGTTPIITNSAGAAVTLANGTTVSGFRIANAKTAVEATSALTGTANIDRITVTGGASGVTGISMKNVTGSLVADTVVLSNTNGTSLDISGGAPNLSYTGSITNNNKGQHSIHVANTTGGTLTVNGTITESQGTGLLFENVAGNVNINAKTNILDSNDRGLYIHDSTGTFTFADFSSTTLFDNAVDLENNVGANISFESLQVAPDQATGLRAVNSGTVSVAGGLINSLNGPALDIQNTAIDMTFDNVISANSTSTGVNFNNVTGTFTANNTTNISGADGTAINVEASSGLNANFGATTITSSARGINLTNNAGGTFAFKNLSVTSTAGTGLLVNDGGTVNFTGASANPTINATGGPAVDITGSTGQTNGVNGWNFASLTSTNSNTSGVILTNLNQDFSVTGATTVSGAGGTSIDINGGTHNFNFATPTNITARNGLGININNIGGDATFGITTINNSNNVGGQGVLIQNVASTGSVTFAQANVTAAGTAIRMTNNDGLVTLNGGAISAGQNGVEVNNTDVALNNISVAAGNDGVVVNTGATNRTALLDNVTVTAATSQGVEFNVNGTGNLTASVTNSSITSTGTAFDAATTAAGGDLTMVFNGNTLNSTGGAGAEVNGSLGGTITVTSLADNTVAAAGAGGMLFNTVTFDASPTTGGIQQVSGGSSVIGSSGARVQGDGLRLVDVTGDLAYDSLDVFNNNGTGVLVDTKTGGTTFNLVTGSGTIDTTNGTAMSLDPLTVNMNLTRVSSTGATGDGIYLEQVAGNLTIGTTNIGDAAGNGINATNNTALNANFGTTTIGTTGDQNIGINLTSNAGSTFTFNNLNVTTSTGTGFLANNGGTVRLNGSGAVINATGGSAIDLTNTTGTTNGNAGWTFGTLSSTNSTSPGVRLENMSSDVAVTGATTVTNVTGNAIQVANNSGDVTFNTLTVNGATGNGVDLQNVTGAFAANSTNITNAAGNGIFATGNASLNANFGNTTIGTTGTQKTGVNLLNNAGSTFTFNNLNITTSDGAGFVANNGGTVNLTGTAPVINATGGSAIDLTNTTGLTNNAAGWTFGTLTSTNSSTPGIRLENMTSNVTVTGLTTVTNVAGNGIQVQNSSGNVTLNRVALAGGAAGMSNGILLNTNTGTFSLNGGASTISNTVGSGILATNQARITIGQVTMNTIPGTGINITTNGSNGTVATILNNTINATGNDLEVTVANAGATMYLDASGNKATSGAVVFQLTNNGNNGAFDVRQPALGAGNIEDVNPNATTPATVNTSGNVIDFNVPPPP